MNEDLRNEIEAINSIYGEDSLTTSSLPSVFVLHLPQQDASLRIQFPDDYPATPPSVLGTEHSRKGQGANILDVFRDVLAEIYRPGEVCLFDVIEEVNNILPAIAEESEHAKDTGMSIEQTVPDVVATEFQSVETPPWILSEPITELKSTFIARAATVSLPSQAHQYLQHLLDNDKKVRSATHNITAWRIKGEGGATYQDCNDDGETAAGGRVLHLMQLMDVWDVMVVVTRGYGGQLLGPKRFSLINAAARDALVSGGWVKDEAPATKKKGKK